MSSIIYGGVKYTKVRHAIYCKKCKETIECNNHHDFKYCSCRSIGIDDERIIGNLSDMENRSMYCYKIKNKIIWLDPNLINF
jgi:hypothetical protein